MSEGVSRHSEGGAPTPADERPAASAAPDAVLVELVNASLLPVIALDLSTHTVIALSSSAAAQLGASARIRLGADVPELTATPESSRVALDMLASGAIDRYQASRKILHPGGAVHEVDLSVQDLAHLGFERRALALITPAEPAAAATDGELGRLGTDIGDLMQWLASEQQDDTAQERVAELESGLLRISDEIDGLTVASDLGSGPGTESSALEKLTTREREVVQRLLRGERVPAIAREIFLSQSTVRNHLCSVYRKFDVHSQVELIERLGERGPTSSA